MEFYPFPQSEGIGGRILRYRIIAGNGRLQLTAAVGLDKTFVQIEQYLFGSCRHRFVGVKTVLNILRYSNRNLRRALTCLIT